MKHFLQVLVLVAVMLLVAEIALAAPAGSPLIPSIDLQIGGGNGTPQETSSAIQIFLILTVLSVAPAILLLMTSFTRIVIVLSFVRNALATQQMPPNQVLVALALFLTFFIMAPTFGKVNETAVQPFMQGKLTQEQAFNAAVIPFKEFMAKQTREKDL
ncbi:flagellar biosynthetic protein FliP, partial [Mesorhizobium sp. M00.F.Ca.ET.186.01.1.1]